MSTHKHFSMDEEAAELLDNHEGNQSELVSNLVKEYFQEGVYDEEVAAKKHRKNIVKTKIEERRRELEELQAEWEDLEALDEELETSTVEEVAAELTIRDSEKIHENNPAIVSKADQNGLDPGVLAEEVVRRHRQRQAEELKSVTADD